MAAPKRVIQMVSAHVDPMAPPKHLHRKAPRGPQTDEFSPVLHPSSKKLTQEQREAWNIPACISNWKNTRGYTIPLDKRLAADGRGLVDNNVLNPNFATLSESLYVAERQARDEVKMRAQVQQSITIQHKHQQEQHLRQLAKQARQQRNPATATSNNIATTTVLDTTATTTATTTNNNNNNQNSLQPHVIPAHNNEHNDEKGEDQVAAQQRERLRLQRKKEREREYRMEQHKNNKDSTEDQDLVKKRRLESDRDVSEKIALGVVTGNANNSQNQVDSRLYNTSSGIDSGYAGPDDEYNTYSRPLFDKTVHSNIYKPTVTNDPDQQYQQLLKGSENKFSSSTEDQQQQQQQLSQRTGPVQFHKST
eukprot:CAMPEP_0197828884 /NCGR_PEP_ID=MMETSP1437-20131217/5390_1 /TAXON_ID=49252 ORGANISM="Eucampia antarctica, Strain CCMP1452" /NCGR_SAMPLE_ID=MMETSP1437 /ASSEMBLY_ACC=CAM_ASM_001096 /LENGTH=363 /DNA_ID=CAMNT_0043430293 /DNA_START=67 /DNA_END=1158 /DNA_ORIENTATION=-